MVGLKEHEKPSSADLWAELEAHEFSKMKEKLERGETTSHNLALTVEMAKETDLLALFTRIMEKLEKKVEKKPHASDHYKHYSSDQHRPRYNDQYRAPAGEIQRPAMESPRAQYSDPPRHSKYEPNPQSSNKRGSYQSKYSSGDKSKLLCHNCKQPGHFKADCKPPSQSRYSDSERRDREEMRQRMDFLTAELSELQDILGDDSSSDEDISDDYAKAAAQNAESSANNRAEGLICLMAECEDEVTSTIQPTHTEQSDESSSSNLPLSESQMLEGYRLMKAQLEKLSEDNDSLLQENLALKEKEIELENKDKTIADLETANKMLKKNCSELAQEIVSNRVVITDQKVSDSQVLQVF